MEPVLSNATNKDAGPPELNKPLSENLKSLSPPYSLPYAEIDETSTKLPAAKISEWKPTPAELKLLNEGGSVYMIVYGADHPLARLWIGPENFKAT